MSDAHRFTQRLWRDSRRDPVESSTTPAMMSAWIETRRRGVRSQGPSLRLELQIADFRLQIYFVMTSRRFGTSSAFAVSASSSSYDDSGVVSLTSSTLSN
jgi:hypothetical protein